MKHSFQIQQGKDWEGTPSVPYKGTMKDAITLAHKAVKLLGRDIRLFNTNPFMERVFESKTRFIN